MKAIVAAELAKRVVDGDLIGVGTGSTVDAALDAIGRRVADEKLQIAVVPTSWQSAWRCQSAGLSVVYPGFRGSLSWGFDGADAVDEKCRVVKGKGGAMLQEKILAARCNSYVIIVDESKVADDICAKSPIPVEVIPEALAVAERELKQIGAEKVLLREAERKHGPVITEKGNLILDCRFKLLSDSLESDIKLIVGVVESGLFLDYATEVLIGSKDGVRSIKP